MWYLGSRYFMSIPICPKINLLQCHPIHEVQDYAHDCITNPNQEKPGYYKRPKPNSNLSRIPVVQWLSKPGFFVWF